MIVNTTETMMFSTSSVQEKNIEKEISSTSSEQEKSIEKELMVELREENQRQHLVICSLISESKSTIT